MRWFKEQFYIFEELFLHYVMQILAPSAKAYFRGCIDRIEMILSQINFFLLVVASF